MTIQPLDRRKIPYHQKLRTEPTQVFISNMLLEDAPSIPVFK